MKIQSEEECMFNIRNIYGKTHLTSTNSRIWQNVDYECRNVEFHSRVKEGLHELNNHVHVEMSHNIKGAA